MKLLRKYLCLPTRDRRLLVASVLWLWVVRLGVWLLPFQTLRHLLIHMTNRTTILHEAEQTSIDRVAWAVTVASHYVPAATCLTQALVAQRLLGCLGHTTCLRLGVAHNAAGQFQAHAWVECQGKIVIGGTDAPARFTSLPPLEGK